MGIELNEVRVVSCVASSRKMRNWKVVITECVLVETKLNNGARLEGRRSRLWRHGDGQGSSESKRSRASARRDDGGTDQIQL